MIRYNPDVHKKLEEAFDADSFEHVIRENAASFYKDGIVKGYNDEFSIQIYHSSHTHRMCAQIIFPFPSWENDFRKLEYFNQLQMYNFDPQVTRLDYDTERVISYHYTWKKYYPKLYAYLRLVT